MEDNFSEKKMLSQKDILELAVKAGKAAPTKRNMTGVIDGKEFKYKKGRVYVGFIQNMAKETYGCEILDAKGAALVTAQGVNRAITESIKAFGLLMEKHGMSENVIAAQKAGLNRVVAKVVNDPKVGDLFLENDKEKLDEFLTFLIND